MLNAPRRRGPSHGALSNATVQGTRARDARRCPARESRPRVTESTRRVRLEAVVSAGPVDLPAYHLCTVGAHWHRTTTSTTK
jgi:hypothetical protein